MDHMGSCDVLFILFVLLCPISSCPLLFSMFYTKGTVAIISLSQHIPTTRTAASKTRTSRLACGRNRVMWYSVGRKFRSQWDA